MNEKKYERMNMFVIGFISWIMTKEFCNKIRRVIAIRASQKKPSAMTDDEIMKCFSQFIIEDKRQDVYHLNTN